MSPQSMSEFSTSHVMAASSQIDSQSGGSTLPPPPVGGRSEPGGATPPNGGASRSPGGALGSLGAPGSVGASSLGPIPTSLGEPPPEQAAANATKSPQNVALPKRVIG